MLGSNYSQAGQGLMSNTTFPSLGLSSTSLMPQNANSNMNFMTSNSLTAQKSFPTALNSGGSFNMNSSSTAWGSPMTQTLSGNNFAPNPSATQTSNFSSSNTLPAQSVDTSDTLNVFLSSFTAPQIFHDDRDRILATFNRLQASWGHGHLICGGSTQPSEISQENPFCNFKAIFYNAQSPYSFDEGYVTLHIKLAYSTVQAEKEKICQIVHQTFSFSQNYSAHIDKISSIDETSCDVLVFVEHSSNGITKRIDSFQLYSHLSQAQCANLLTASGMELIGPECKMMDQLVDAYLSYSHSGVDPLIWEQAVANNPDPGRFLPVVVTGFSGLKQRIESQHKLLELQKKQIKWVACEIQALNSLLSHVKNKIRLVGSKIEELFHSYIRFIGFQEIIQKRHQPVTQDEVQLVSLFENAQKELEVTKKLYATILSSISYLTSNHNNSNNYSEDIFHFNLKDDVGRSLSTFLQKQQENVAFLQQSIVSDVKLVDQIANIIDEKV